MDLVSKPKEKRPKKSARPGAKRRDAEAVVMARVEQPLQHCLVIGCYEAEYSRKKGNTFEVEPF